MPPAFILSANRQLAQKRGMLVPVRFRLYPQLRSSLYLVVQVWPSLTSMRQYLDATYLGSKPHRRTLGMCSSFKIIAYPKGKRSRTKGIFAEVNLASANLTMRIITHEMLHATMAYARRVGLNVGTCGNENDLTTAVTEVEEKLAYVHGTLCSDFVARASDLGFFSQAEPTPWKPWHRASA